jgi:hypothetical protein
MTLCTDRTLVNEGPSEGTIATLKCKRWSCPNCLDYNRRQVVAKARDGNPTTFMTLTWNANRRETPDEAARVMKHAWVVLRRRIAKRYAVKNIPFIVVFERTKKGYPHMHILLRAPFIKQEWLSEQMADLIDAPIVDIRAIKDRKHAFWYITKYLGKDLAAFEGCKRWWRSHNYEIETEEPYRPFLFGGRMEIVDINYWTMKARVSGPGFEIVEEKRHWCHFRRRIAGGYDPSFRGTRPVSMPERPGKRYSKLPMVGDGWGRGRK